MTTLAYLLLGVLVFVTLLGFTEWVARTEAR